MSTLAVVTGGATVAGAGAGAAGTAKKSTDAANKQEFMNMLVTQLKYQNPLKPMDGTDFTAQLAQFSSLEQLTNLNTGMEKLTQFENSLSNVAATGLIGNGVTMSDKTSSTVSGITFDKGITYLKLANGNNVLMSDVTDIYEPTRN
jgi:flagellar basal-body rod modification protein FlgD